MKTSTTFSAALAAALVFSPWSKDCPKGKRGNGCVITTEARTAEGVFVAGAVVVQKEAKGAVPMLRVGLPLGVALFKGVTASVDGGEAIPGTYTVCLAHGCLADVDTTPKVVERLLKGKSVTVKWSDENGEDASCAFPLDGLAKALSEPPTKETAPAE
jgi:invasion protein IalB